MKLTNDIASFVSTAGSNVKSKDFVGAAAYLGGSVARTNVKRGVFGEPYVYSANRGWSYLSSIIDVSLSIFKGISQNVASGTKISAKDKRHLKALLEMIKAKNEEGSTETEKAGMINGTRANKIVQMEKMMKEISSKNSSWSDAFSRVPLLGRIFA